MACVLKRAIKITSLTKRNIMTTSQRLQKAMEKLEGNPYYEKYAQKIAQLQKTSPEEISNRIEQQEETKTNRRSGISDVDISKYSSILNPKKELKSEMQCEEKKLDKIFRVDLVADKTSEEIQSIWVEYHKQKDVIAATLPKESYEVLTATACKYPIFLFPLPKEQGYEFIMCQTDGNSIHFTPLLAYQVHKENAPECLTITHYTDFSDKGIILMRGEYDKNVINVQEAQCLANQYQLYYNNKDKKKIDLLNTFTNKPDSFKHTDLIEETEHIGLL